MHRHLSYLAKKHKVFAITDDNPKARHLALPCNGVRLSDLSKNIFRRILLKLNLEVLWIFLEAKVLRNKINKIINTKPDCILSVWSGPFLLAAADISQRLKVPLILIMHDDWQNMLDKKPPFLPLLEKKLKQIFQKADCRLCVSAGMIKVFQKRYGRKKCEILFPVPGAEPLKKGNSKRAYKPFRIGFFGQFGGNFEVLRGLADELPGTKSTLTISSFGESADREWLARKEGVIDMGFLPEKEFLRVFSKSCDVILIPQGFEKIYNRSILRKTCFPSKIPEACRFGLPLLVIGPKHGSAYQWAKKNLPQKSIITKLNSHHISSGIKFLQNKKNWLKTQKRIKIASQMFDPKKLHAKLEKNILQTIKK